MFGNKTPASAWLTGVYLEGCPVGLEPTTFRTTIWRSNQLNYGHRVQGFLFESVCKDTGFIWFYQINQFFFCPLPVKWGDFSTDINKAGREQSVSLPAFNIIRRCSRTYSQTLLADGVFCSSSCSNTPVFAIGPPCPSASETPSMIASLLKLINNMAGWIYFFIIPEINVIT